ncbi:hypothetical protein WT24_04210 [Burkholderia sp. MSMB1078WGS]|nr:hypothetical protein WT24_04210 [Burkholderia sp. MSMB1078WGS]
MRPSTVPSLGFANTSSMLASRSRRIRAHQACAAKSSDSCRLRRVPTIDLRTVMPFSTVEKIGNGKSPGGRPLSATVPPRRSMRLRAGRRESPRRRLHAAPLLPRP